MEWTPLPIGVENYEEIIEKGYYYVDKTLLIKDLIDLRGKVCRKENHGCRCKIYRRAGTVPSDLTVTEIHEAGGL